MISTKQIFRFHSAFIGRGHIRSSLTFHFYIYGLEQNFTKRFEPKLRKYTTMRAPLKFNKKLYICESIYAAQSRDKFLYIYTYILHLSSCVCVSVYTTFA